MAKLLDKTADNQLAARRRERRRRRPKRNRPGGEYASQEGKDGKPAGERLEEVCEAPSNLMLRVIKGPLKFRASTNYRRAVYTPHGLINIRLCRVRRRSANDTQDPRPCHHPPTYIPSQMRVSRSLAYNEAKQMEKMCRGRRWIEGRSEGDPGRNKRKSRVEEGGEWTGRTW